MVLKKEISVYFKSYSLGMVLVAETYQGICTVLFGHNEHNMMLELSTIFPNDKIVFKTGASPDTIIDIIDKGVSGKNLQLDILTGTDFQRLVWNQIVKIPRGQTITYKELAEQVGSPKSWRAVGKACGENVIAYLIPCHRVVSKTGDKMNYRWGSELKRKLLNMEAKCK